LGMAGAAVHDPVGALLMCQGQSTAWTIVNGQVVADHGQLTRVDLGPLIERHNMLAQALIQV
jgi:8-oxoguanine deaminase